MAKSEKKIPAKVQNALKNLPKKPGVYRFFDEKNQILYIGKAKNLKNRVKSYFQNSADFSPKTAKMISKIADFKWIETASEAEALVLEANLVRELLPPFNVLLRDDKHFLYLKITRDIFPNVEFSRKMENDGAAYFGPFTSAKKIRDLVDFLREILHFRRCKVDISQNFEILKNPEKRKLPCLDFQISRCDAPCAGKISVEKYAEKIALLKDFLRGKTAPIKKMVHEKMIAAAAEKKFETAARMRDLLASLEFFGNRQIADAATDFSANAVGFFFGVEKSFFVVAVVRRGKILRVENFSMPSAENPDATIAAFFRDFPKFFPEIPPLFFVKNFAEREIFAEFFSEIAGKKVEIRAPARGAGRKLLDFVEKNAAVAAANSRASFEKIDVLEKLQKSLGLKKRPERIECFDISHLSGTHAVGSRVVFLGGKPAKSEYRKYKIRDLPAGKIDDFAAMAEVLGRRLRRLSAKTEGLKIRETSEKTPPDGDRIFSFFDEKSGKSVGKLRLKTRGKSFEIAEISVSNSPQNGDVKIEIIKIFLQNFSANLVRIAIPQKALKFLVALKSLGFSPEKKPPKAFEKKIAAGEIVLKISPKTFQTATQKFPDLLVIDGGKGQLSAVVAVLKKLRLFEKIPVVALAKKNEEIFVPEKSAPLPISKAAPENELLQNIRDEAHRFAISFNRHLRKKAETASRLDLFSKETRTRLLQKFGDADAVFAASEKDLRGILTAREMERWRGSRRG